MEIILLERIRNLGDLGDQVTVKPGYGRNYLIPQGKAVRATKENQEAFEGRRSELEAAAADALNKAQARAAEFEGVVLEIARRASEEGKLFGSVAATDIIEAAAAVGKALAERAKKAGVSKVAFDRSGFKYHGRIKALADAAREQGMEF